MSENSRLVKRSRFWQLRIGDRRVMLLIGDLTMALIALGIALIYWGSSERFLGFSLEFLQKRTPLWFYFLPIIWLFLLIELYDINKAGDWGETIRGIFVAGLVGIVLYLLLYFYYFDPPNSLLPRRGVASFLILVALLTLLWRALYIRVFAASQFMRRVLLVGGGKSGKLILSIIDELKVKPFFLVGIVDDNPKELGQIIEGYKVMGSSNDLLSLVEEQHISDIIVAITGEMHGPMFQALLDTQERGVEITRMPVAYEELLGRVPIQTLEANWILRSFVDETRVSSFYILGKRLLDMLGGLVGVLGLILVFPLVTIAILLDDGFPVIYGQVRSGRGGQSYRIIKFRTMRRDAEPDGHALVAIKDDARATRIGRILRKTHLDELPQFLNVLGGDMSLVGPRAERPELIQMFQERIPFYRARLLVKPGITGWAQVNQAYASTVDETITKLEYDLYYIKHRNLIMDMIILLRTPAMVLGFRGR
jgi:exopolysaccharide biosynthesis polyprenyl glycosylphosphotransferase